ncbi:MULTISPECIES: FAD-dependent monooxygenase [Streptosporangium]|uniref:2-polyprenyl-6-methoxyphenol hydroxylase-like FAD-dependent oxidoreductase n=1 Tax=Streptosporangium brasiliense TaxID=47480 RepID=A0ABT9RJ27_9ACTN|nr:FAD-dependent monooxygenase [Streptosporangium brasiliense]MDP9869308.1 2-polyprenyl-6-methoxyphenol hydroxylase-like FAD-dependent oxidoreductase [Streptosporangium brasiliense]
MNIDVIIVGAGPTGLMLAAELGLAGVSAVVVERLPARSGQSKALGLQPRTAEVFEARGLLGPLIDRAVQQVPGGHFAGLRLDFSAWDTAHPYMIGIPQARVEELLEARVVELGVKVLRGHGLTTLTQDDHGVTATAGPARLHGRYLVGCDGGRSTVRELLGAGFPGLEGRLKMAVADLTLTGPAPTSWSLPVMTPSATGKGYLAPLGDGVHRFLFYGPEQHELPRDAPITPGEVSRALTGAFGPEVRLGEIRWASRFTDASRQVTHYRHGRVLLAGDAAHIHSPMGGQGLNLGLQDAFNLGWKLAAELSGQASDGLLDTYHTERHPVAARVLANTRAQAVLLVPDEENMALRAIVEELLTVPEANRMVAGMISGLDIRYALPGEPHPLLGRHLPGLDLRDGRAVVLSATDRLRAAAAPWSARVGYKVTARELGAEAVLVRPDGYIGWTGSEAASLTDALSRWAGSPTGNP